MGKEEQLKAREQELGEVQPSDDDHHHTHHLGDADDVGKLENGNDLHDLYDDCILMFDSGFLKFEHCQGDPGAE